MLLDGEKDVQVETEGFRDPHVIGRTQRMGIGYTKGGKILLVHVRKAVTFDEMATVFEKLGCFEAMNLDAGASLAMYCDGKTLQPAGRQLTNLIGVWIR